MEWREAHHSSLHQRYTVAPCDQRVETEQPINQSTDWSIMICGWLAGLCPLSVDHNGSFPSLCDDVDGLVWMLVSGPAEDQEPWPADIYPEGQWVVLSSEAWSVCSLPWLVSTVLPYCIREPLFLAHYTNMSVWQSWRREKPEKLHHTAADMRQIQAKQCLCQQFYV